MLAHGALMATAAGVAFSLTYAGFPANIERARTAAFFTLAFTQLFYAFACRSERHTMPAVGPFTNPRLLAGIAAAVGLQVAVGTIPFMQRLFKVQPLAPSDWLLTVGVALVPVTIIEVLKWVPMRNPLRSTLPVRG